MNQEVIAAQDRAIYDAAPSLVPTPMAMLSQAIEKGVPPETLEKLMALAERWEANQARKAFDAAMAEAKAEMPVIVKNREVDFTGTSGKRTNYRHEDLAGIASLVDPVLAKHGLSYRYRTSSLPNEPVTVTCIVSHRLGHSEENPLSAGRDDSGNKNSVQAVGSTITYLQRYTLKAALGLAVSNDDDGRAISAAKLVTEAEVALLQALILDVGGTKAQPLLNGFLKKFRIGALVDLPATEMQNAIAALNAKRVA